MTLLAPDSGMAMGIGLVMLCMIVTPSLLLGAVAYALAPTKPRSARPIAMIVGVLAGPVMGLAVVMATFELPLSYFVEWVAPSPPPPAVLHDAPADAGASDSLPGAPWPPAPGADREEGAIELDLARPFRR